jgi:hypothetical protein
VDAAFQLSGKTADDVDYLIELCGEFGVGFQRLSSEEVVKDIRRATRKRYSAEEKIRILLDDLRGEHSIPEL